jgi:hypothetical protein
MHRAILSTSERWMVYDCQRDLIAAHHFGEGA